MKILFTTSAGTGHLEPIKGIAKELIKQGHTVKVAAAESFVDEIKRVNLEHLPFDDSDKNDSQLKKLFSTFTSISRQESEKLFGKVVFGYSNPKYALPKLKTIIEDFSPDLIISEMMEFSGPIMALKKSIPFARVGISLALADKVFLAPAFEGVKVLLDEEKIDSEAFQSFVLNAPYLTYFPESLEDPSYSSPPGQTIRLLHPSIENGSVGERVKTTRPFVYVTLATVASEMGFYPRIMQQIIDGIKTLPVDALITVSNKADKNLLVDVPENIQVENWVDQQQALQKADLVICHAGSGTTLGALAFGLPIIAVPLFADQFINAERIEAVHAGVALSPDNNLEDEITKSVQEMLKNPPLGVTKIASEMATLFPVYEALKELFELLDL